MSPILLLVVVLAHVGLILPAICYGLESGLVQLSLAAVFASLLGAVDAILGIHYFRVLRHYSASVKLQPFLSRIHSACARNVRLLNLQIGYLNDKSKESVKLDTAEVQNIEDVPIEIITELLNLDAVNDLLEINSRIESCNINNIGVRTLFLESIAPHLDKFTTQELHSQLHSQLVQYSIYLQQLASGYQETQERAVAGIADLRILYDGRDIFSRWLTNRSIQRYPRNIEELRREALAKLALEAEPIP